MASPSERATKVVQERGKQYGDPSPIMETWWALCNAIPDEFQLRAEYGAISMILLKIAREIHSKQHIEDHMTDVCGWANVYEMVKMKGEE
jgi:Domain of unknown function (DUF6378)